MARPAARNQPYRRSSSATIQRTRMMARPGRPSQHASGAGIGGEVQTWQAAGAVPQAYPRRTRGNAKCELSVTGLAADLRSKLVRKSATAISRNDPFFSRLHGGNSVRTQRRSFGGASTSNKCGARVRQAVDAVSRAVARDKSGDVGGPRDNGRRGGGRGRRCPS